MEHIRTPKVENVSLIDRASARKPCVGTLYLTATHSIFVEHDAERHRETWVLHSLVSAVEKLPATPAGCSLLLRCKNFQVIQFVIPQERDCQDVHALLTRLSRPERYTELYCFAFNPNLDAEAREESWNFIDLKAEFVRMGLPNSLWQMSTANREYRVCDTYPGELYVPKSATLPVVLGSARFRSRGRLPVLTYYHRDNSAAICRSSQPLSGFSARCLEDEQMLQAISSSNPGSSFMYVVDTRPKLNAMANRAAGKGYESEDNYANIKFHFLSIENIHVMRSSQQKMLEVCEQKSPSMAEFLWGLESSGWLKHIKGILDAGVFIAKAVAEEGASVLVHCSDGWDRTAQACSVASVLLDPYYRTLKGLMVLIERDWVSFGHKFSHRYSHVDGDPREVSPVMDQFLECVWQLSLQFPCAFEYNERFLLHLHDQVYSCQYGNFLGNCQKDRVDLRLREKTHSVWWNLWKTRADYTNPLYRPDHSQTQGVLRPTTAPYCFKFWRAMYCRSDPGRQRPPPSMTDVLTAVREESQQLEAELSAQQEKIANLSKILARKAGPMMKTADERGVASGSPRRTQPCLRGESESPLKRSDPDLSASSDQESGVTDLSCLSPSSGEESTKDPDSDEAAYSTA
ncbi:myotubularin-related protein 7b isoform X1 [Brienomyrus brachyistius]|uniref:myotubularin-related protein 7b isoform X1 n=1 Tax=Brienomyrus brachyistius TaxID=42636 RepID=UPI0020B19FF3|nr:myotubularin-related protein 7b isoform X1 [Brienomyrus brachyistius]XP_048851809.1 myotubularin-related protein 7b isoform X1 [Brienomyrus brachyistius]XP_048851810.1 myotubularin-related protein 7b isoform X1 [Brienomyrus brachyistius]